jgi:phosphoglycolate phosphatase-like HAD superfamily hydrolase
MGAGGKTQVGEEVADSRPALDHVILDWNGTLLADTAAAWRADNDVLAAFGGRPIDMATFRETLDIPFIDFYARHGAERAQIEANPDQRHRIFSSVYESGARWARTRRGARKLLSWLGETQVQRVILSNDTVAGISSHLARLGLASEIDLLLANEEFGSVLMRRSKEEKLVSFLASVEIRKRVAVLGDSPEEVEIGRRAGIWTVAISQGEYSTRRLRAARPHFLVHSLHQAVDALRQIGKVNK